MNLMLCSPGFRSHCGLNIFYNAASQFRPLNYTKDYFWRAAACKVKQIQCKCSLLEGSWAFSFFFFLGVVSLSQPWVQVPLQVECLHCFILLSSKWVWGSVLIVLPLFHLYNTSHTTVLDSCGGIRKTTSVLEFSPETDAGWVVQLRMTGVCICYFSLHWGVELLVWGYQFLGSKSCGCFSFPVLESSPVARIFLLVFLKGSFQS